MQWDQCLVPQQDWYPSGKFPFQQHWQVAWLDLEWKLQFSTSKLYAEGSLMKNTSAEMSPVARQANAGKLIGQKPEK